MQLAALATPAASRERCEFRYDGARSFPAGDAPRGVAIADLTGEGLLDVVVADQRSDSLHFSFDFSAGEFARTGTFIESFARFISVTVADFDHDGREDVAACSWSASRNVVVLLSSFGQLDQPSFYDAGDQPWSIAAADFDGDGALDLLTSNWGSDDVSVLYNDGAGGFPRVVTTPAGERPRNAAIGDLDEDGDPDVVTANEAGGNISVLLNAGGELGAAVSYGDLRSPSNLLLVDWNGDRSPEVLVSGSSGASIRLGVNDGSGAFPEFVAVNSDREIVGFSAGHVADLDADGAVELVLLDGSEKGQVRLFELEDGYAARDIGVYFAGRAPVGVASGDLDHDGIVDLVVTNHYGDDFVVLPGVGGGRFSSGTTLCLCEAVSASSADLDGDGDRDLVLATGEEFLYIARNSGAGRFEPPELFGLEWRMSSVIAIDVDADGHDELVGVDDGVVCLVRGTDDGLVNECFLGEEGVQWLVADDFDGDGSQDLALSSDRSNALFVYANDGGGGFEVAGSAALPGPPDEIATGDWNGDRFPDLASPLRNADVVAIALNDGEGGLRPVEVFQVGRDPAGVAFGDFDGDGLVDLACGSMGSAEITILLNRGSDSPPLRRDEETTYASYALASGDWNLDGLDDLAVTYFPVQGSSGASFALFFQTPESTLRARYFAAPTEGFDVHSADFNGDGATDFVVTTVHDDFVWISLSRLEDCREYFLRGDVDDSGGREITDAIRILSSQFLDGVAVPCTDAADVDDSGDVMLSDAVYLLSFLFLGGPPPVSDEPSKCEFDSEESQDDLGCESYEHCN